MNEKLIPANDTYWDYKMLTVINGKRKQTLDDYMLDRKAEQKAKLLDNICMSVILFLSYTAIGLLIFLG